MARALLCSVIPVAQNEAVGATRVDPEAARYKSSSGGAGGTALVVDAWLSQGELLQ